MIKILRLKAQINVPNLAKLKTCVQSKYFHTEETELASFVKRGSWNVYRLFRLTLYVLSLVKRRD